MFKFTMPHYGNQQERLRGEHCPEVEPHFVVKDTDTGNGNKHRQEPALYTHDDADMLMMIMSMSRSA